MKPEQILNYSQSLAGIGRPVAYYPNIGKALKSKNAALLVCQFLYWEGKQAAGPGTEVVKSYPEVMDETGLTESEIDSGRKVLEALKIGKAKAKGNPAKLHWLFDWGALDRVLHDWLVLQNGAAYFKPVEAEPTKEKVKSGVPTDIYKAAVDSYFTFCENPRRMGKKPMFGPAQGKTIKDLLKYLKGESITQDWPGALTMLEYLFLSWDNLTEHYRKQVELLDIRRNINNIIGQLNNGVSKKDRASRVNANAVSGY